jgi:hypothetical protein
MDPPDTEKEAAALSRSPEGLRDLLHRIWHVKIVPRILRNLMAGTQIPSQEWPWRCRFFRLMASRVSRKVPPLHISTFLIVAWEPGASPAGSASI